MSNEHDDYKVGYGRPPLQTRFERGRSGNPKGRKKASKRSMIPIEEILNETQTVQIAGRRRTMTKSEIIVRRLTERAMQGDVRAIKSLIDLMPKGTARGAIAAPSFDVSGARAELERKFAVLLEGGGQEPADRGI